MTVQDNIKQAFKTLIGELDEKNINIIETFNEGKWDSVYICASRFMDQVSENEVMEQSLAFNR